MWVKCLCSIQQYKHIKSSKLNLQQMNDNNNLLNQILLDSQINQINFSNLTIRAFPFPSLRV